MSENRKASFIVFMQQVCYNLNIRCMKMGTRTGLLGTGRKEKGKYEEAIFGHGDGRDFGNSYAGGCGASASKVTAESLLQEVQSKCDAMKSLETHTTAEITLESDALGGTMDMTMDMTMQTTIEPVANYLKGNISIPGLGTAMDMENYTVVQDDQILLIPV